MNKHISLVINTRNTNECYYLISYVAYILSNYLYDFLFSLVWVCWRSGLQSMLCYTVIFFLYNLKVNILN